MSKNEINFSQIVDGYNIKKDLVVGADGYLFIGEGSNKNLTVSAGLVGLDDTVLEDLNTAFNDVKAFCSSRGIGFHIFVFPNKERVVFSKYPLKQPYELQSISNKFVDVIEQASLIEISENPINFRKQDSHMSFDGNDQAFEFIFLEIMNQLNLGRGGFERPECIISTKAGDLGKKINQSSEEFRQAKVPESSILYHNEVPTRTKLKIYTNAKAQYKKRILCFGDSFTNTILPWFTANFYEVIFFHSSLFHRDLVELIKPDFVYSGYVERFLVKLTADIFPDFAWYEYAIQIGKPDKTSEMMGALKDMLGLDI